MTTLFVFAVGLALGVTFGPQLKAAAAAVKAKLTKH